MNKSVLDTDILSEILKRKDARIAERAATYLGNMAVSPSRV